MSRELEAWERFKNNIRWLEENTSLKQYFENNELHFKEDLDLIETTLEDYNTQKQRAIAYRKVIENNEEKLKVLEIIKNKKVDVSYIIENPEEENVIWYNARFMGVLCEGWRMLSQEEYDLVRKALL